LELPVDINKPRSIRTFGDTINELLVLERQTSSIVYVFDSDGDGIPDMKQTLVSAPSLNHGLAVHDGYVYASSDSTVYRWSYNEESKFCNPAQDIGPEEVVVVNINENGRGGAPLGHRTRTLEFDTDGRIYISVGSDGNVDPDSYRSRIRRGSLFSSGSDNSNLPLDFQMMEVFADGLRNEVGLAFDKQGVLWGVENSADNLEREDLGGRITNDNPAEELNRFREQDAGKHYGYPYCWTEYGLPQPPGLGIGTVWAWPSFLYGLEITDQQCRENYEPPMLSIQAHSAPLGIVFYDYEPSQDLPVDCRGIQPFPEDMDGFAFIAYHGSWNRDTPTGYKVVYVPMADGVPTGQPIDLLAHEPPNAKWEDGFRPVDVDFDICGRLYVTSDGTQGRGSKIVRIEYAVIPESSSSEFLTDQPSASPAEVPPSQRTSFHPSCSPSEIPISTPSATGSSTTTQRRNKNIYSVVVVLWVVGGLLYA